MKIELKEITIEKLVEGFLDSAEQGVVAYDGKLDIRPPYQREFIYKDKHGIGDDSVQRNSLKYVLRRSARGLNKSGRQQRTSICPYVPGTSSAGGVS